jgi:NAD(P)-dependent dehydrogenase (short-subunit alcohol dehydrogenase family)
MAPIRVLVTGGGRGIGRAIALRFAREGGHVAVAARHSDQLDAVVAEIEAAGGKGLAAQMNIMEHGGVEAAVWRALQFTGGVLDVLVNNAGVFLPKPFPEIDRQNWQQHIDVNLTGAFYVTSEALDALLESDRPHVFNIASQAVKQSFPGCTAYNASKYGLVGFSNGLRFDLRTQGVRVSTVYPGATDTEMMDAIPGVDRSTLNKPEDVAEVVFRAYNAPREADVDEIDVPAPGASA